jgi:hypothetical protein
MQIIVQLYHPARGVLLEQICRNKYEAQKVRQKWINTYGKAIVACSEIKFIYPEIKENRYIRPVINIDTGIQ